MGPVNPSNLATFQNQEAFRRAKAQEQTQRTLTPEETLNYYRDKIEINQTNINKLTEESEQLTQLKNKLNETINELDIQHKILVDKIVLTPKKSVGFSFFKSETTDEKTLNSISEKIKDAKKQIEKNKEQYEIINKNINDINNQNKNLQSIIDQIQTSINPIKKETGGSYSKTKGKKSKSKTKRKVGKTKRTKTRKI